MSDFSSKTWKELAEQKEREWKGVLESRIHVLEQECQEREAVAVQERAKLTELKEHFKYNLKLLEQRDEELSDYDAIVQELRSGLTAKMSEISELKIHLDDLRLVIEREEKIKGEMQDAYQQRIREKQVEVDSYKSTKDGELQEERGDYEEFRRKLQRQLTSVQSELDTQRREMNTEFENESKKREHEFRLEKDGLNTKVMEFELKTKMLERELELVRESSEQSQCKADQASCSVKDLEKAIKTKEWELADLAAIKEAEVSELQTQLVSSQADVKRLETDYQRKYAEMDRTAREREEKMDRLKSGYQTREEELRQAHQGLQSQLEDAQITQRQMAWNNEDLAREKEAAIERLQTELQETKEKWDRHVTQMSREHVGRDLELSSAKEEQRRLQMELDQRKDDLNRYKKELQAASDREEKLDRSKVQSELDWQRRCEDLERMQYEKSEDLIKRLMTARNEAEALAKERERELQHNIYLVRSLHKERDQMRQAMKEHGVPLEQFPKYSIDQEQEYQADPAQIAELKNQNESLKTLVSQMRQQMESLGQEATASGQSTDGQAADVPAKRPARVVPPVLSKDLDLGEEALYKVKGQPGVADHIWSLNHAIGALRSEKVDLAASVKKYQARIGYLESCLEEHSKQPRAKQLELDQLSYQLEADRQRHQAEVTGLRSRVKDVERQLAEARREADEYHRSCLEGNQELVAMGNQLSALKMQLSDTSPAVNFGAQELYIQQLQTELSQLRKRSAALEVNGVSDTVSGLKIPDAVSEGSSSELRSKLKLAALKIVQLAKENQQLTESNNRLRATLKDANDSSHTKSDFPATNVDRQGGKVKDRQVDGRLSQLEQLQYQLTKQELRFAQAFQSSSTTCENGPSDPNPVRFRFLDNQYVPEKDVDGHDPEKGKDAQSKRLAPSPVSSSHVNVTGRRQTDATMLMSMSSGGGESIQKVWQMLDDSEPSSIASPRSVRISQDAIKLDNTPFPISAESMHQGQFEVQGHKANVKAKTGGKPSFRQESKKLLERVSRPSGRTKVRNYNHRDDN